METQPQPFDAVLIDLDGTLVETERLLYRAWVELVQREGHDFTAFDYARIIGRPEVECCEIVSAHYGFVKDPNTWYDEYRQIVIAMIDRGELSLRPYAETILTALSVARVPLALVTSGTSEHVHHALGPFRLMGLFRAFVTADTLGLAARKPDPAPYLLAASFLGVDPKRCIAFEDSPTGVRSARRAGCFVFAIPHEHSPAENLHEAHVILASLADFDTRLVH